MVARDSRSRLSECAHRPDRAGHREQPAIADRSDGARTRERRPCVSGIRPNSLIGDSARSGLQVVRGANYDYQTATTRISSTRHELWNWGSTNYRRPLQATPPGVTGLPKPK